MVRVLIVDDSAVIREMLFEIFAEDPEIEVVGAAPDPLVAREMIKEHNPDVLTLDIEMPRMDGLDFLERLMRLRPMPVVMISSHVQPGAIMTIRALEIGAVDVVGKPVGADGRNLFDLAPEIIEKVKSAAKVQFDKLINSRLEHAEPAKFTPQTARRPGRIVGIGASTGGVQAINNILPLMPPDCPPIMIVQHMPPGFTRSFAERLDRSAAIKVVEAEEGMPVLPGQAYIAPGDFHLEIARSGASFYCKLRHGTATDKHTPSVDVLFNSMASAVGASGIGIILTGMGADGSMGLKAMRMAGAATACQDEASSLIYGMPKVATQTGAAQRQIPLFRIPAFIVDAAAEPVWPVAHAGLGLA